MAPHDSLPANAPDEPFVNPYHRVYRIDPVAERDLEDASELWKGLGTHNGDPMHAKDLINESLHSFREGKERFTLIGKNLEDFDGAVPKLVRAAIGSVIYHDHSTPEGTQHYYAETADGLSLESLREDAMELGGMYVAEGHRGVDKREIGVAMTMLRALMARKFGGIIGPHRVYADFLPPLYKGDIPEIGKIKVPLGNDFWYEVVHPALQAQGSIGPISEYCARALGGVYAQTREHLYYQLLVQLKPQDLNYIFSAFFPKELKISTEMHGRMRAVFDNFGDSTKGAQVNVAHAYPDLNRIGYNPVDAGQNWAGSTHLGAVGDRTVTVDILDDGEAEDVYRNPSSQSALILLPIDCTRRALQNLRAVVTPGVFSERLARIPRDSLRLLVNDFPQRGEVLGKMPSEITYRTLPSKSPTK